jgi:nucleotide-binding universal stress UspA family protein
MDSEAARHILAPVDFSELSAHALRYAARLAKCSNARVTALYADLFQPPPYFTEGNLNQLVDQLRTAERQAEAHLRRFVAEEVPDLEGVEVLVREGLPADAIRRAASDEHADLIVMGTHGRSGFNRLMLGSITERVLREAAIPVLTVRGDWEDREIRRIVCPVNGSEPARRGRCRARGHFACLGVRGGPPGVGGPPSNIL